MSISRMVVSSNNPTFKGKVDLEGSKFYMVIIYDEVGTKSNISPISRDFWEVLWDGNSITRKELAQKIALQGLRASYIFITCIFLSKNTTSMGNLIKKVWIEGV